MKTTSILCGIVNDGWIDRWTDGWMGDGWMDGWMDGWTDDVLQTLGF